MVRRIRFIVIVILLAVIIATAAATQAYTAPAEPQTRVETDQKAGAIRLSKGARKPGSTRPACMSGQRVDYGGMIVDEGEAGYDARQAKAGHAR
jgi:hypothetical protein